MQTESSQHSLTPIVCEGSAGPVGGKLTGVGLRFGVGPGTTLAEALSPHDARKSTIVPCQDKPGRSWCQCGPMPSQYTPTRHHSLPIIPFIQLTNGRTHSTTKLVRYPLSLHHSQYHCDLAWLRHLKWPVGMADWWGSNPHQGICRVGEAAGAWGPHNVQ